MEVISGLRTLGREKSDIRLWTVAAVVAMGFLISRACFMEQMFPAGIALIIVLLCYDALNFYLLPVMLMGIGTFYSSGIPLWGDMGALCGCALLFLFTGKIRFSLWHKAIIGCSITIIARSVYYIAAGYTYRISIAELVLEGCLVAILCGIFQVVLDLVVKKQKESSIGQGIFAGAAVLMLLVAGMGLSWLLLPAAMVITLLAGYLFGIMEGLLAGFTCGLLMFLCGGVPGAMLVLAMGGAVAGFSRGQNKVVASHACKMDLQAGYGLQQFFKVQYVSGKTQGSGGCSISGGNQRKF